MNTDEEWRLKYEKELAESKARLEYLLNEGNFLDDDGYPTDDALEIITLWNWNDAKGWFEFIKSLWAYSDWGWNEQEVIDEVTNKREWCYYISTAGWSGNESIIGAMEKNTWMWGLNWVQSRRGGHYIFQLKTFKDEKLNK